ncbi:ribonuclease H-like domain-containing protein [Tanacetum coccineum]
MDQDSSHMMAASKVPMLKPSDYKKDSKGFLLKQQYEKFTAPSLEILDQTFDRLQKLVSQLELLDENLSQEDVNQKLVKKFVTLQSSKKSRQQEQGMLRKECACGKTSNSTALGIVMVLLDMTRCDQAEEAAYSSTHGLFQSSSPDSRVFHLPTHEILPPTPDLSFTSLDEFVNKPVVENSKAMSSKEEPKVVRKYDDAPSIEEWVSDDEEEDVSQPKTKKKTVRPSIVKKEFVKSKQQEKTARKTVKQVEQHRQNTHSPRGNQRNWNNMMSQKLGSNFEMFNKACYVCGSFDHLQVDCNYHQKQFQNQRMVKPVWNNAQRVNHQNFAKKTHPCAKKNLVPRAVLMKSGLVSINTARQNISKIAVLVNTARQVNTAHSKTTVNAARPMSYLSKIVHSTVKIPIHKNTTFKYNNINQRVNNVRDTNFNTASPKEIVNAIKGNNLNVVKASACWVWKPKHKVLYHVSKHNSASIIQKKFDYIDAQGRSKSDKRVIDSGCSRHMTGNMFYLTDYEEINGGYVAFGGNLKGGKITGKYTIKAATRISTSGILKSFITRIENLVDHKVKVIRCDNGTEFKNREMNQFCEMKGILRQFSIARTPQQNGVAKRRNRTLIEAARTMLADSKLPTTFWAEAVNTACYVQI